MPRVQLNHTRSLINAPNDFSRKEMAQRRITAPFSQQNNLKQGSAESKKRDQKAQRKEVEQKSRKPEQSASTDSSSNCSKDKENKPSNQKPENKAAVLNIG